MNFKIEEDVMFPILGIQNHIVMSVITIKGEVDDVLEGSPSLKRAASALTEINSIALSLLLGNYNEDM